MYGRSTAQDRSQIAPGTFQGGRSTGGRQYSSSYMSGVAQTFPIFLALGLVLYFVWALVEQHERVRNAVRPQNVGLNLRNIAVILLTVVLGLNLLKVITAKLCAWGVPGAKWAVVLVGGA